MTAKLDRLMRAHLAIPIRLNAVQKKLVAALKIQDLTAQELSESTNLSLDLIITELGTLEILGVITRCVGNRFHLPLAAM